MKWSTGGIYLARLTNRRRYRVTMQEIEQDKDEVFCMILESSKKCRRSIKILVGSRQVFKERTDMRARSARLPWAYTISAADWFNC